MRNAFNRLNRRRLSHARPLALGASMRMRMLLAESSTVAPFSGACAPAQPCVQFKLGFTLVYYVISINRVLSRPSDDEKQKLAKNVDIIFNRLAVIQFETN